MPRPLRDPIEDGERLPDIGFLIQVLKPEDTKLWQALNRLKKKVPDENWIKTFFYLGTLAVAEDILTHQFVVDIPNDKEIELLSLTLAFTDGNEPTSRVRLALTRKSYGASAYESVLDDVGVSVAADENQGERFDFIVPILLNGDRLQVNCIEDGDGATNPQMAIRGKLRTIRKLRNI